MQLKTKSLWFIQSSILLKTQRNGHGISNRINFLLLETFSNNLSSPYPSDIRHPITFRLPSDSQFSYFSRSH